MSAVRTAITATSLASAAATAATNNAENQTNGTAQIRAAATQVVQQKTTTSTGQAAIDAVMSRFSVPGALQGAAAGAMPGIMGMNPMAAMMGAGMGGALGGFGGGGSGGGGSSGSSRRSNSGGSTQEWNGNGCTGPNCGVNPGAPGTNGSPITDRLFADSTTQGTNQTANENLKIYKADKATIESAYPGLKNATNGNYNLSHSAANCGPCQTMEHNGTYKNIPGFTQRKEQDYHYPSEEGRKFQEHFGLNGFPANVPIVKRNGEYYFDPKFISKLPTDRDSLINNLQGNTSNVNKFFEDAEAAQKVKEQKTKEKEKGPSEILQKRFGEANTENLPEAIRNNLAHISENGQDCSSGRCKINITALNLVSDKGSYFTSDRKMDEKTLNSTVYLPKGASLEMLNNTEAAKKFVAEYNQSPEHKDKISLHQLEVPDSTLGSRSASKEEFTQWFKKDYPEAEKNIEEKKPLPKPEEEKKE